MLKLALRIAGGIAVLAAVVAWVGPARLLEALRSVEPARFAAAFALAVIASVASALRWSGISRALKLDAPFQALLPMYFRGITSNTLLPGATVSGDLLRTVELSRRGNPVLESAASVAFDRISGLWTLCALSFLGAGAAALAGTDLAGSASDRHLLTVYGTALGAIVVAPFIPWPVHWVRHLPLAAAARVADLWERVRDPSTGLRRGLAASVLLSMVVQAFSAAALATCAWSLGVQVSPLLMLAAAAPIFVMASVPIGVAGFGTRELAAVPVLALAGVSSDLATATSLLYGLCAVIQGVLAAPLFLGALRRSGA